MSHFNTVAPANSLPDPAPAEAVPYGPIYSAYPRMEVGFALIAVCWLMQVVAYRSGPEKASLATAGALAGLGGYIYWLFCVHRIHKILAEYTQGKYPIAPWKSVAFLFIPLYAVYWIFKWPATLANFVSSRPSPDGNARLMRRRLPAIALLISTMITPLFGFEIGIGFQLALVFAVGLYLTRNLERVLPRPEPICLRRLKQLTVSASAGVGAAFSLLVFEAFHDFFARTPKADRIHELVVIGLVSVGVMVFLEPLSEKLRLLLVHDHIMLKSKKSLWLRLAVLGVLLSTSLLDGMAHTAVENWMKDPQGPQKMMELAAAMLISGGITYFWIGAGHLHRPHAMRSGAFSGAALAVVAFLVLSSVASPRTAETSMEGSLEQHFVLPGVPSIVTQHLGSGDFSAKALLILAIPWLLMGLAGGAVIDKRWAHSCAGNLALSVIGAGIVAGLLLRLISPGWTETFAYLPAVGGWVVALILCCSAKTLGLEEAPAHSAHQPVTLANAVSAAS